MAYEFRLQDPGEGIHEAEIIEVKVSKGSHVEEGDDVLVVETDKAAVDIPAPVTGKVIEIRVSEGDIVEVGNVLMVLEEDGAEAAEADVDEEAAQDGEDENQDKDQDKDQDRDRDEEQDQDQQETGSQTAEAQSEAGREEKKRPSEDKTEEATETRGSDSDEEADDDQDKAGSGGEKTQKSGDGDVLATPAVRGLARELGVKLDDVPGSGKDGRVLEEDVRKAAEDAEPGQEKADGGREPVGEGADGSERIKLRSLRRSTARRMSRAWRDIPHVTHHDAVDITEIERMRRNHAAEAEERGSRLTLTPFLMKAVAGALNEHPRFNARFDTENLEIELLRAVNMGVALDTGHGLIVPVIRDVRRKTLLELADELTGISEKLTSERAAPETLKGGTITLTNVGSIGGTGFSPIINAPEVAIFGAGRAELRQVMEGDIDRAVPVTRLILPVCVAFDHRVNDGADAARFMNTVKLLLSDPQQFALRS